MLVQNLNSVQGILVMLKEEEPELQCYALNKLNRVVDTTWHEIAD